MSFRTASRLPAWYGWGVLPETPPPDQPTLPLRGTVGALPSGPGADDALAALYPWPLHRPAADGARWSGPT